MKIASQLASAVSGNDIKSTVTEDASTGFQSIFSAANAAKGIAGYPQGPAAKDIRESSTVANPRAQDTKKKDAASDQAATGNAQAASTQMIVVPAQPVSQLAMVLGVEGVQATAAEQGAEGLHGAFALATAAGVSSSIAPSSGPRVQAGAVGSEVSGTAGGADETDGAASAAKSSLHAVALAPMAPGFASAASEAASTKGPHEAASANGVQLSRELQAETASSRAKQTSDATGAEAAAGAPSSALPDSAQSIAAAMQFPTGGAAGLNAADSQAAGPQGFAAGPVAGQVKGAAARDGGASLKGKTAGLDVRGKKSEDASGPDRAAEGGDAGTGFTAKISGAMAAGDRGADASRDAARGAIDAAMPQPLQAAADAAGAGIGGHIAGQGTAADGKGSVEGAAQTAAQAPVAGEAMPGVSSARLVQSANSSEMRLGMQSAEFGNISISTSLNHQALSAQISIDHSELGKALAAHLPAIEEKLGTAYGVQAKVELRDSHSTQSGEPGYSNSGQQSREQRQSQSGAASGGAAPVFMQGAMAARASALTSATSAPAGSLSRLDIRV